jgi:hypothetical protein
VRGRVRALKLASDAGAALESSDDDDAGSAASRSPSLPPSMPPSLPTTDDEGDDEQPDGLQPSPQPSMPPSDDERDDEQPDALQQMLDAKDAQDAADVQTRKAAHQLAEERMPSTIQINPLLEKLHGGKVAAADEPGPPAETQAWGDQGGETQAWASGTQDEEGEADSEGEPIAELATKRRPRSSPHPSRSASPVAAAPVAKRSRKILDSNPDSDDED